jgi:hypothetical protein
MAGVAEYRGAMRWAGKMRDTRGAVPAPRSRVDSGRMQELVDRRGVEPLTSAVQRRRSPN